MGDRCCHFLGAQQGVTCRWWWKKGGRGGGIELCLRPYIAVELRLLHPQQRRPKLHHLQPRASSALTWSLLRPYIVTEDDGQQHNGLLSSVSSSRERVTNQQNV